VTVIDVRNYTQAVHISGTNGNNRLHDYLHQQLSVLHYVVTEAQYDALLSYHDWSVVVFYQHVSAYQHFSRVYSNQLSLLPSLQCFDTVGWATGRASGL